MFIQILALFVVILDSPDTVLIERAQGKRVDPTTGGTYNVTFLQNYGGGFQPRC